MRVALQQTAITGSAEPLVAALKQADERLARYNQPRLEGVRRAVARDLDRVQGGRRGRHLRADDQARRGGAPGRRAAAAVGARAAQEPAHARGARRRGAGGGVGASRCRRRPAGAAGSRQRWGSWSDARVDEVRSLVRVTRIDQPEAMLIAPEQAYFLRENLKLRLLNARLALLAASSTPRSPTCRSAQASLDRYFDRSSRKPSRSRIELMRQVAAQARQRRRAAARRHAGRAVCRRPRGSLTGRACAPSSGSCCCSPWRWSRRPTSAPTTASSSFYWARGASTCRSTCSCCVLLGTCFVLVTVIQAVNALIGLPQRAREWRVARRERSAQAALRDALAQYFGGRYSRAQKAAQRALAIQADTPELAQDNEFTVLGHLLAAGSLHRLQDRARRDEQLQRALDARAPQPRRAAGRRGRAAAGRRMGARRSRCARARSTCWPSCRPAWRGARRRCA